MSAWLHAFPFVVTFVAVCLTALAGLMLLWRFGRWVYVAFSHHPDHDIVAARKRKLARLGEGQKLGIRR